MSLQRSPTLVAGVGPADLQPPPPAPSQVATRPPEQGPTAAKGPGVFEAGTVLADRYKLETPLGRGGVGSVWRATHTSIGKAVAVKLLAVPAQSRSSMHHAHRLLREAQSLSRIRHPNVVDVIDHGYADDGTPFIAMELIEGRSLFEELHPGDGDAQRRGWAWTRDVALQVLDGLQACHAAGIVHRDIKPENVLISSRSGTTSETGTWVTLVDFGIAFREDHSSDNPRLTREGAVFGTPLYMSPEQAAASPVDHRADIYAFGCVLHEMLSGQPPFEGTPSHVLAAHLSESPPTLEALASGGAFPRGVLPILERCLHKDPSDRFQTVGELYEALADPALAEPVDAKTTRWGRAVVVGALSIVTAVVASRLDADPVPADVSSSHPAAVTETTRPGEDAVDPEPSLPEVTEATAQAEEASSQAAVAPVVEEVSPDAEVAQAEAPKRKASRSQTRGAKRRGRKAAAVAPGPAPMSRPAKSAASVPAPTATSFDEPPEDLKNPFLK